MLEFGGGEGRLMLEFGGGEGRLIRAFGGCAELLVDFWTGAPIYEQILPSTLKFR